MFTIEIVDSNLYKGNFCKKISGTFVGSMFPAHYMYSIKLSPQAPFSCALKSGINIHKSDTINMILGTTILPKRYLFPLVEHVQS